MFERLRYLEPSHRFRTVWQYQNLMFMTAGLVLERLAGESWEQFTERRIMAPLGMKRSNFSVADSAADPNHALPHVVVDGITERVPFRSLDAIGPAGSINSSAADMIRFVQFHLERGKWGEHQLLSGLMADQMRQPQVVIPRDVEPWDEVGYDSYGMGMIVGTYRGHKIVHHGGGIDGFISSMSMMPSKRLGVVILSNPGGGQSSPHAARGCMIYDRMLSLEPIDWIGRGKTASAHTASADGAAPAPRPGTSPSHPLAEYAGTYAHPGYGDVRIEWQKGRLSMSYHGMTTPARSLPLRYFCLASRSVESPGESEDPVPVRQIG